jgi:hypothetical protein
MFLIPLSASSQMKLHMRATIAMPVVGSSSRDAYPSHTPKAFSTDLIVRLDDTIALVIGSNIDTLRHGTWLEKNNFYIMPYEFQFDSADHAISSMKMHGRWMGALGEALIEVPLVHTVPVSDSMWEFTEGNVLCSFDCFYDEKYLMPNGENGETIFGGKGTTSFGANILSVHQSPAHSSLHITSLTNGAVRIETDVIGSPQPIEIFDALGRQVVRETMEGNSLTITTLRPGCYFARIGSEIVKFVVID